MKINSTIYLDHQATTPVDPRVFEKMQPYFCHQFGNPHSSEHFLGWQAAKAELVARTSVAGLICADPDEVVFTSGATEANNLAIMGLARKSKGQRKRILVSSIEHKSVIESAMSLKRNYGFIVEEIPVDNKGIIDIEFLKRSINESVLLISIMAVNNEIGSIQPISEIGKIALSIGAIFHCDASQAPCAIDLDVVRQHIDLLSLSSHKIYGPKGVGILFVRRELHNKIEPLIYGGGQQNGLRAGTVPVPLCVGMGAAVDLLKLPESQEERHRLRRLRGRFVDGLQSVGWPIRQNGPELNYCHPGNINIRFEGFSAHDVLSVLQPGLAASTGSACNSNFVQSSHVLKSIGLTDDECLSSIRFSLGRFTTEEDTDEAILLISKALSVLS